MNLKITILSNIIHQSMFVFLSFKKVCKLYREIKKNRDFHEIHSDITFHKPTKKTKSGTATDRPRVLYVNEVSN